MRGRVDKTSVQNPRRSSHRAAKTTALSALTTSRTTSSSNAKRVLATKTSISPLHDIRNKPFPPKKRWKARGQLLLAAAAAAKVTPHRTTVPLSVVDPPTIETTSERYGYNCSPKIDGTPRNNNRSHGPNGTEKSCSPVGHTSTTKTKRTKPKPKHFRDTEELPALQEQASPEPLILARLNLDGGFEDSTTTSSDDGTSTGGNGDSDRDASCIRRLRSVKVMTYCHQDDDYDSSNDTFPVKLYRMVQFATLEYPGVCRWSRDGRHVEIDSKHPVLLSIIRRYFKRE
jgi:hypothetical protein